MLQAAFRDAFLADVVSKSGKEGKITVSGWILQVESVMVGLQEYWIASEDLGIVMAEESLDSVRVLQAAIAKILNVEVDDRPYYQIDSMKLYSVYCEDLSQLRTRLRQIDGKE